MTYYIAIDAINGINDLCDLASRLNERGYDDRVEYNAGGWSDNVISLVTPHLKFVNEEDALAYVLAYGGNISTILPTRLSFESE